MIAQAVTPTTHGIYQVSRDGVLTLNLHAGQRRAYWSDARFTLVLAGTQSGKTSIGPAWLFGEMQRRGPGDYLIASPTFPLMEIKVIPEFKRFFITMLDLGEYVGSPLRKFTLSPHGNEVLFGTPNPGEETHIYFGYGSDPDSLESATYKGAWLDEAGQKKFKFASWEAILRRLSIAQGRVLITTTPYTLGWLKMELHDKAATDPDIRVVNFPSNANPAFSQAEWDRAQRTLPAWKFKMFYRGQFTRPAGLIYDCFDPKRHVVPAFPIPEDWPRYQGADFGGVHTAGVWLANEPGTNRYYAYREYLAGGRTARQHAAAWLAGEPGRPEQVVGGSPSEDQWRDEFTAASYPIWAPDVKDVEVGINRVYGAIQRGELFVLDTLTGLLDELLTYSRVLDDNGEPTEAIEDKATFHRLDALRYIGTSLWDETAFDLDAFYRSYLT